MATIIENENSFPPAVYQLATSDPVKGGAMSGSLDAPTDGQANAQAQALASRTAYLRKRMTPIGVVEMYAGTTAPFGYLVCDGSLVLRATYPELFAVCGTAFGFTNTANFRLPDLRGRFVRMVDGGAGLDPDAATRTAMNTGGATGNNIGSVQGDEFEAHTHTVPTNAGLGGATVIEGQSNRQVGATLTSSTGGSETRPVNAYLNFIIKAFN